MINRYFTLSHIGGDVNAQSQSGHILVFTWLYSHSFIHLTHLAEGKAKYTLPCTNARARGVQRWVIDSMVGACNVSPPDVPRLRTSEREVNQLIARVLLVPVETSFDSEAGGADAAGGPVAD